MILNDEFFFWKLRDPGEITLKMMPRGVWRNKLEATEYLRKNYEVNKQILEN